MWRHSLTQIQEKRARSEPLPSGAAPFISSSMFKFGKPTSRPMAKSRAHQFSIACRNLSGSKLKASTTSVDPSGVISLSTARPSPQYCPWESLTLVGQAKIGGRNEERGESTVFMHCDKGDTAYDLSVALNYGYAAGSPQVLRFITEHVEMVHQPPYSDWETCLNAGTTSAIDLILRLFCDRDDWILTEAHTYSGTIDALRAHGVNIAGIPMDDEGIVPDELDLTLRNWEDSKGRKPCLLYMIPSGQNPIGVTQSTERRKTIYKIAEVHDLYIIEDDPYYFLQLGQSPGACTKGKEALDVLDRYMEQLPPSYLSLDTSGRVLRLDSTSKILSPGLRCGWMTGCSEVIHKLLALIELTSVAPSGPSQMMMYKLLDETWGHKGFIGWLNRLSKEYRLRRDILLKLCSSHLPRNCRWGVPSFGMFVWICVDLPTQDTKNEIRQQRLVVEDQIYERAKENGVLISKGSWFAVNKEEGTRVCFRLTFAAAETEKMKEAICRLGRIITAEAQGPQGHLTLDVDTCSGEAVLRTDIDKS